jgi:hypothetical protein
VKIGIRREAIGNSTNLRATLSVVSFTAGAQQQPGKVPRIGYLPLPPVGTLTHSSQAAILCYPVTENRSLSLYTKPTVFNVRGHYYVEAGGLSLIPMLISIDAPLFMSTRF